MRRLLLTTLALALGLVPSPARAGYAECPAVLPGMINVHWVAHTHNDVGWLKTVDQYYYGHRNDIQRAGVQYILDSVVTALAQDKERRFIYVESAFFWRWWGEQGEERKELVRQLLAEGRLEFIGGGWSMNDEAAAHYTAIIDNMAYGIKFLTDNLGPDGRPRVAWQIDPFGHSREQANIFAHMGFDGLFFGRLDYDDKNRRMRTKSMEMIWSADVSDRSGDSDLFTGALFRAYSPPPGFCFDSLCRDVIMDDRRMEDYNFDSKISEFVNYTQLQAKSYASDNLIMTMGEDFNYAEANMWFKNLDKIRNYFNKNHEKYGINILYSTPSCYLKSLHDTGKSWPTKTDDFFPYASDPHAYWTGYFTSRSSLKGMIRSANSLLQATKQVHTMTGGVYQDPRLEVAKRAVAVNQHHDAVTGTAKQHVTDDYALRLDRGMKGCSEIMMESLGTESGCQMTDFCPLLNISQCHLTETSDQFTVMVYNPLTVGVDTPVRLPVSSGQTHTVLSLAGDEVAAQLVDLPEEVLAVPGRESQAEAELVFMAEEVPPLGYRMYSVRRHSGVSSSTVTSQRVSILSTGAVMENDLLQVHFNKKGVLTKLKTDQDEVKVSQDFAYYRGAVGNNSGAENRASGAYIFRPDSQHPTSLGGPVSSHLVRGPLVQEVHQRFNDWTSQVIRLYKGQARVEMEWMVGPLPSQEPGTPGLEVISQYFTDIKSEDTFGTDSNGRLMISRKRNYRPTWQLNLTEPVSSNYYPVVSRMSLTEQTNSVAEERRQVWLLVDRAEGGTSRQAGQMELMLHRRLFNDDAFGVGEALNETAFGFGLVVRGKHSLVPCLESEEECDLRTRILAERSLMKPVILLGSQCTASNLRNYSGGDIFPPSIKLLTLEMWNKDTSILVRLENIGHSVERVSLENLFSKLGRQPTGGMETTLDGNMNIKDLERLAWNGKTNSKRRPRGDQFKLTTEEIRPKQIRTFLYHFD